MTNIHIGIYVNVSILNHFISQCTPWPLLISKLKMALQKEKKKKEKHLYRRGRTSIVHNRRGSLILKAKVESINDFHSFLQ